MSGSVLCRHQSSTAVPLIRSPGEVLKFTLNFLVSLIHLRSFGNSEWFVDRRQTTWGRRADAVLPQVSASRFKVVQPQRRVLTWGCRHVRGSPLLAPSSAHVVTAAPRTLPGRWRTLSCVHIQKRRGWIDVFLASTNEFSWASCGHWAPGSCRWGSCLQPEDTCWFWNRFQGGRGGLLGKVPTTNLIMRLLIWEETKLIIR